VKPTVVGGGWDRWFLMLHAAGASPSVLAGITSVLLAAALIFGFLSWGSVRNVRT
jgi:hypothetical protein